MGSQNSASGPGGNQSSVPAKNRFGSSDDVNRSIAERANKAAMDALDIQKTYSGPNKMTVTGYRSGTGNQMYGSEYSKARNQYLADTDWTQEPVSNVVFNTIELSSDAVYSTFSMTSNNAAISVDDTVTFGSVTGVVTDVYMVTPPYDTEEGEVPDGVVTVKTQMTEHVANGSIINFTTAANTEVSFTGVVANTVSEAIIDGLAVGETITSGSVTVDIHEIVVANSTANIIRVITHSDIPTGAVTLNSAVTFAGTADTVTSMAAYGHPGNYIDENVHSQFVTYRQELRDLPATYAANVYAVVYPSYPDYQVD